MKAVILAAGEGKRLRPRFSGPKPLIPLLGISLIERNILSLKECGIKEFVVITGCRSEEISSYLGDGSNLGVNINYLHNPDWKLGNGISAYTFRKLYRDGEKFILLMSDHIFELHILKSFLEAAENIKGSGVLLAADKRLNNVFDLAECTKIRAEGNYAVELGKDIKEFNAVDCGLFIGNGELLEALAETISQNLYNLTDGINVLAKKHKVLLHFIDGAWVDVDDLESYRHAEKIVLESLVPAKDGFFSRILNRKLSLRITKILARTAMTPNQITFISFLTSFASAVLFATINPFLGGVFAQLSSIIDGVDGEIARLKYMKSKYGGLLDAVLDRYADFFIAIGMGYAWYAKGEDPYAIITCIAVLTGIPMSMLFKEKYHALTGKPFIPETEDGVFRYLPVNRDGRMFVIMLGGILDLIPASLIFLAVTTHLQAIYRLYKVRYVINNNSLNGYV